MGRLLVVVRTLVATVVVGGLVAAFGAGAAAQDSQPGVELLVSVGLCPDGPEAPCEPAVGVAILVTMPGGGEAGRCTTEALTVQTEEIGGCYIGVPRGAALVVTEDPTTLPAGYVPLENPKTIIAGPPPGCVADCIAGVRFLNVLEAQPTASPNPQATAAPPQPTQAPGTTTGGTARALPNTGTGSMAGEGSDFLPIAASLLALVGGAAYGLRRRVVR